MGDSDSPSTFREVERKLRVADDFELPELTAAAAIDRVEALSPIDLDATYFDTPELALFRWRITLRHRTGGHDAGWHLKLPVQGESGSVRDEVSLPETAGSSGQIPPAFQDLITAFVRENPIQEVARIKNHRMPYSLLGASGEPLAELVHDNVEARSPDGPTTHFREIEVEATSASVASLKAIDQVAGLIAAAGGHPESTSKAAVALGPRAEGAPDVSLRPDARPTDPAADAIEAFVAKHVHRFLLQDVRVRRDLPDSVHKMRVAARRLRSGLDTWRPLIRKSWGRQLRSELKWVAAELAPARDTEVVYKRLAESANRLPPTDKVLAANAIDRYLLAEAGRARKQALNALRSDRYARLLDTLVAATTDPEFTKRARSSCAEVLPPLVSRAFSELDQAVHQLSPSSPGEQWHTARKSAKRARYAAEAIQPVFGEPAATLAKALEEVTEVLGSHQDTEVAQQVLQAMAQSVDGPTGFSLGELAGWEADAQAELKEIFAGIWPRVRALILPAQLNLRASSTPRPEPTATEPVS